MAALRRFLVSALSLLLLGSAGTALAGAPFISGTSSVTYPNDPGFEGLYKYCVELSWDTGASGLSHASVFIGLETCECICNTGVVQFPTPAGTSTGDPEPCVEEYVGDYQCAGDPTIPQGLDGAAVKFEHDEIDGCEPGQAGTGTFCFYSVFPPAPYNVDPQALGLKYGQDTMLGELVGFLPICQCVVPTRTSTWSMLKRQLTNP